MGRNFRMGDSFTFGFFWRIWNFSLTPRGNEEFFPKFDFNKEYVIFCFKKLIYTELFERH